MSDGYQRNPNQKPPTVLSEYALRLNGEPVNGAKRPPGLMVNVKRDGKSGPWCVNFECRTNVENDKDFGKITFLLDMPTMFCILQMIQDACNATEAGFNKIEIHNRRFIRAQNAMSKEPMLDGTIAIGRTASGQIYIGIKSWDNDRPNCKFILRPVVDFRRAVKLFKQDGSPWEDGPLSQLYARGWAKGIGELLANVYASEYVPAPPREMQGGQGGGGGGNNGGYGGGNRGGGGGGYNNNGGGGQSPPPATPPAAGGGWGDDDIPM